MSEKKYISTDGKFITTVHMKKENFQALVNLSNRFKNELNINVTLADLHNQAIEFFLLHGETKLPTS